jgi:hypothetical protein
MKPVTIVQEASTTTRNSTSWKQEQPLPHRTGEVTRKGNLEP